MNITATPLGDQPFTADNMEAFLSVLADGVVQGVVEKNRAANINAQLALGLFAPTHLPRAVQEALAAGPASGKSLDAIAWAYELGDVIELRALHPDGGGAESLCGKLDDPAQRKALERFIAERNGRMNLFVGINPRAEHFANTARPASAADVVARRAVVLDLDFKDAPLHDPQWTDTVAAIGEVLDVRLCVDSGNGVHVWFRIADEIGNAAVVASAETLALMMKRFGADNMADAPRIIRLPFSVNLPTAAKRARGAIPKLAVPRQGGAV
jgi:hypothetical protein